MDADLAALPDDIAALKAALAIERARVHQIVAERDAGAFKASGQVCGHFPSPRRRGPQCRSSYRYLERAALTGGIRKINTPSDIKIAGARSTLPVLIGAGQGRLSTVAQLAEIPEEDILSTSSKLTSSRRRRPVRS
jgi:hypothetical protein